MNPIIKLLNSKVTKVLFSVSKFLSNSKIPIPFKKIIIDSYVLSKVSYFAPLLGSNKARTNNTQKLINKELRWIAGLQKAKSFINVYSISKDLNIPPLSAKCTLSQVKCFDKWKDSNCTISYLVNNIPKSRKYMWMKESRTLKRKLEKRGNNDNKIKDFYWKRDMKINSIKAEFYEKKQIRGNIKFYKTLLCAKIIDQMCPNFCPCCKSNKQWLRHWLIDCPFFFNHIRSKVNDKFLFLYNAFNRGNLTNDIVNSNNDNSNSNNSNSNNSYSNISNSIINNVSNSIENNVYVDSSVCKKVFNFLLGGRSINSSTREWKDLFKCQIKSGAYPDTPFLVVTAALLQLIIPIAIGQQWSLFNRFKLNRTTTKNVNAEETVRQASRASAINE